MYKQIIICRRDLHMSPGKLAAQVSHGSMAFLMNEIKKNACPIPLMVNPNGGMQVHFKIDEELYRQWFLKDYTKCVLRAKNKNQLLKAKTMAEDLGMTEGEDFWLIYDLCKTEIEPEENGKTLTAIGFRPLPEEIIDQISKKYHLYM